MSAGEDQDIPSLMRSAMRSHAEGRLEDAASVYRLVLKEQPGNADAQHLLGVIAHQRGEHASARAAIEAATALDPYNAAAFNNLGEVYRALGRAKDAEHAYRRALALKPDHADAYSNLGLLLRSTGRLDEAEAAYAAALVANPGLARARLNYALLQLLRGDFAAGFENFESRFEGGSPREIGHDLALLRKLDMPRWNGSDLRGRSLLVWTEQGLGDTLMMMRYLPLLQERGAGRVLVYCHEPLVRLLRNSIGMEVLSRDAPLPRNRYDCHCPLMSMPLAFGTGLSTIPSHVPYVAVPEALRAKWAARLAPLGRPRVGLAWAGGELTGSDSRRSIPLAQFAPVLAVQDVDFVSLQKGKAAQQARHILPPLHDWMDRCTDLLETAALIDQLDLVISVDTAVAHLAGALGKPLWLLSRAESEWRWMLEREDSPWYPTLRLFRQSRPGAWDEVLDRVALALRSEATAGKLIMPGRSRAPAPQRIRQWLARLRP